MRYVVAMIFAVAGAALAMFYLSGPIASWTVDQFVFESPDEVGNLHTLVFMGCNLLALLLGWFIGWMIAGPLSSDQSTS